MKNEIINILFRVLMCGLLGYLLGTTIRKHNEKEVSQPQNDTVMVEFKSQICTTREQSERLLALGLKKETADMALHFSYIDCDGNAYYDPYPIGHKCTGIPAWSLHRLIKLTLNEPWNEVGFEKDINPYEQMIKSIAWLIERDHFPKEYLV